MEKECSKFDKLVEEYLNTINGDVFESTSIGFSIKEELEKEFNELITIDYLYTKLKELCLKQINDIVISYSTLNKIKKFKFISEVLELHEIVVELKKRAQ